MRPISIRFRCFGPYMDEQYLDFTRLEQSGVFLISGETGAGKTTILDAMCYALYGRSSGGLRGGMEVMRCALAEKTDETFVEFVFESAGRTYRFTRSLKYGRTRLNDRHDCMELRDGQFVPIFANPRATAVNHKAEEIIGLNYDQFRQVIVLPQGQFEKLLVSNSEEKEAILVTLFHADRWQRIADDLTQAARGRMEEVKQQSRDMELRLKHFGCAGAGELREKAEKTSLHYAGLQQRHAQAGQALADARRKLEQALLDDQDFKELEKRRGRVTALAARQEEFDREEGLLALADRAGGLRSLHDSLTRQAREKGEAESQAARRTEALARAQQTLQAARSAHRAHLAAAPEQDARRRELTRLQDAEALYRSLSELEQGAKEAGRAWKKAAGALDTAQKTLARKEQDYLAAAEAQSGAIRLFQHTQQAYRRGIGGILARELEEGTPCPVCGSLSHPRPAPMGDDPVTDRELEECSEAMDRANERAGEALAARGRAVTEKNEAAGACAAAEQRAALARRDLEAALARRVEGVADLKALNVRMEALREAISEYDSRDEDLSRSLSVASAACAAEEGALGQARQRLEEAGKAYETGLAQWTGRRREAGFDSDEAFAAALLPPEESRDRREALSRCRAEARQAEQALREQLAAVAGREKPDEPGARARMEQRQREFTTLSGDLALALQQREELMREAAAMEKLEPELAARRLEAEEDMAFAMRLSGRSGISLQRYVLGVMLSAITAGANRLLEGIYGGRYRLHRTDGVAGSARKSGLELEVFDSASGTRRSVTTLSGGEKFLVALSLAIGLSAVVQARSGGMRLEAMFVDEGFGSLDRESVADALEVLHSIGRSAGVVGVISHVEQLREVITTRVEVEKGPRGSRFRVLEG